MLVILELRKMERSSENAFLKPSPHGRNLAFLTLRVRSKSVFFLISKKPEHPLPFGEAACIGDEVTADTELASKFASLFSKKKLRKT